MKWKFGQKASTTEDKLIVNERFPALNHRPLTTGVREAKGAANLYLEYKICQLEAVDGMSGVPPIEEDDGRHSKQQVMTTAGVAGESMAKYAPKHLSPKLKVADLTISESRLSRIKELVASQKHIPTASIAGEARVDVHATISDRWKAHIDEMSILATLGKKHVHSSPTKGKNQNPETSWFESPSHSRSDDLGRDAEISSTAHEAARAYDAGRFYARKKIDLNFHDSATSFVEIQPVSLEEAQKSASSMEEFKVFVKQQAEKAARRARYDPEWKRTYHEWCLQVMWFNVCRIFWL
ncbi:unnamed protein product [Sphagnum tenellum]